MHSYFTIESYFSLYIPLLFKNFDKILYLDVDILAMEDVANLYNIDLEGMTIGATINLPLIELVNQKDSNQPNFNWKHYLNTVIRSNDPSKYFQSGVLIWDLTKTNKQEDTDDLITIASSYNFALVHQDVMNIYYAYKIKYIDQAWNFGWDFKHFDDEDISLVLGDDKLLNIIDDARNNPKIIHYAGIAKPWTNLKKDLSKIWWKHALETPFKRSILIRYIKRFLSLAKDKIIGKLHLMFKKYTKSGIYYSETSNLTSLKYKILGIPIYSVTATDYYKYYIFLGIKFKTEFLYHLYFMNHINAKFAQLDSKFDRTLNSLFSANSDALKHIMDKQDFHARSLLHQEYFTKHIDSKFDNIEHKVSIMHTNMIEIESKFSALFDSFSDITKSKFDGLIETNAKLPSIAGHEASRALVVYNQHQKVFPKYKNIHLGKTVVLVASGPSLNQYNPIENAVHVGVNFSYLFEKVVLDYQFFQDGYNLYSERKSKLVKGFFEYKNTKTKFVGFLDPTYANFNECIVPEFYSNAPNVERYYNDAIMKNKTFPFDIASEPLCDPFSVVFAAMQFILWTHPKCIYIVGCDCTQGGHFTGPSANGFNGLHIDKVIPGWHNLKKFIDVYYPDIEVISLNPVGLKGLFKDEFTS